MRHTRAVLFLLAFGAVILSSMSEITDGSVLAGEEGRSFGTDDQRHQLEMCINDGYLPKLLSWQESFVDCVPALYVLGTWWSSRPRRNPVTIITHATINRLPQLHAQCRSWEGSISVVLYTSIILNTTIPSEARLDLAQLPVLRQTAISAARFADTLERDESALCQLDLMLVVEVFSGSRTALLYPYNVLRNLARLQASDKGVVPCHTRYNCLDRIALGIPPAFFLLESLRQNT